VFWGAATARDPKHAKESLQEMMKWIVDGKLHPHVSAKFPLAEGGKAIRLLMDRKAQGKVVVTM
jgi:NADPH2:quinone reductase